MIIQCVSPNPKCISNSKCHHYLNHCKCNSECICLTNYCSPCPNTKNPSNLNNKQIYGPKITYEINSKSKALLSPAQSSKKIKSMLYQNISPENILKKSNSLFNIREKIYKENNMKPDECTNILVEKCKNVLERKKCPDLNKNSIKKNRNKKDELIEKIRNISNKIDKTINLYRNKQYINSSGDNLIKNNNRKKFNDISLHFQYSNSKILENMRKENEKQSELINMKIKNLSQINNISKNIYKQMYNNNEKEIKKTKANYAKLNKQKKFYIENNINLNKVNEYTSKVKDLSNYYRINNEKNNEEQFRRNSEYYTDCYCKEKNINNKVENKDEKVTYIYDSHKNNVIYRKKDKQIYNKNSSFDDSNITKKTNNHFIKSLKKNLYKKDVQNKNKNPKNYNTEKNRHTCDKNRTSQYIYTMRNKNEKYNNNYYKEIVHKKRENSSLNNDSLIEIRNNKSVDMKKNIVINRENSENNRVFNRNNSFDYKKTKKMNINHDNLKINEINYRIVNENNFNENQNDIPVENKIFRNDLIYQNNRNNNREDDYKEDLNKENINENDLNNYGEINYQKENNYIDNNYEH